MCLLAYFFFPACNHNSEVSTRKCAEPESCVLRDHINTVRIPWSGHSYCDECFITSDNFAPLHSYHLEVSDEEKATTKRAFHAIKDHAPAHGRESHYHLQQNKLDLFEKYVNFEILEDVHKLCRTLEITVQNDAARQWPKRYSLDEKCLVVQLRRGVQQRIIEIFALIQRCTSSLPNHLFLAMDDEDKHRVIRQAQARTSIFDGFDKDGFEVVRRPCGCILRRAELESKMRVYSEVDVYYRHRWYTLCSKCDGISFFMKLSPPCDPVPPPWWLAMLNGKQVPNWQGGPNAQAGLVRRATSRAARNGSNLVRRATAKVGDTAGLLKRALTNQKPPEPHT